MKELPDLTEFNELSARYDENNFARIEKVNEYILKIIQMEMPDLDAYDRYNEKLLAEIKVRKSILDIFRSFSIFS